jgi:mRNA interferase RelE/StbE
MEAKPFKQVAMTIMRLLENATPNDSAGLKGHAPYRRVDIGERRIIYRFDETTVYIAHVGKRNDAEIYRILKRGTI